MCPGCKEMTLEKHTWVDNENGFIGRVGFYAIQRLSAPAPHAQPEPAGGDLMRADRERLQCSYGDTTYGSCSWGF